MSARGRPTPLGRLADAVLGDRKGKHPETRSAPRGAPGAFADQFLSEQRLQGNLLGVDDPAFSALPGGPQLRPGALAPGGADVAEFLRFRDAHHGDHARAGAAAPGALARSSPEHPLLSRALHSAVASTDPSAPLAAAASASEREAFEGNASRLPLNLSPAEKTVIRARSAIMARHLHADAHESGVARAQLEHALAPLGVEVSPHAGGADARMEGPRHIQGARGWSGPPSAPRRSPRRRRRRRRRRTRGGGFSSAAVASRPTPPSRPAGRTTSRSCACRAAAPRRRRVPQPPPLFPAPGAARAGPPGAERWAEEFSGVKQSAGAAWAAEFRASPDAPSRAGDAWASEFGQEQESRSAAGSDAPLTAAQAETAAQSARLAATLAADPEGKFRNSQFLQFMSRMSRGELVAEGDGVTERSAAGAVAGATAVGDAWASEYAAARADGGAAVSAADPSGWAGEFRARSASTAVPSGSGGAHRWADEFADWAGGDWAGEFQEMASRGEVDGWTHDSVWNAIGEESKALAAERSSTSSWTRTRTSGVPTPRPSAATCSGAASYRKPRSRWRRRCAWTPRRASRGAC